MKFLQRILALVAVLFGVATILAGTRVLLGSDPGYAVFRPLLVFNTVMGAAYVAAGALGWVDVRRGKHAAATIFVLNGLVLAVVGYLYLQDAGVAVESVRAMMFRTGVWLVLFVAFAWLIRKGRASSAPLAAHADRLNSARWISTDSNGTNATSSGVDRLERDRGHRER